MTTNADEPTTTTIEADPDTGTTDLLRHAADLAIDYRSSLPVRRVGVQPDLTADDLRRRLGGPLPQRGTDARDVIDDLAAGV